MRPEMQKKNRAREKPWMQAAGRAQGSAEVGQGDTKPGVRVGNQGVQLPWAPVGRRSSSRWE